MSRRAKQPDAGAVDSAAGSRAEEIRLRYLYRSMIQSGKIRLPLRSAVGLIGPDCAFHLYSTVGNSTKRGKGDKA